MDCHVFRRLCDALCPLLSGARLEKIHQPAPGLSLFTLYAGGCKRLLYLRAERQAPFLFLSAHRIPAPPTPPAAVMLLRKYLCDRRIVETLPFWPERRLLLRFKEGPAEEHLWLELNLKDGPRLWRGPLAGRDEAPVWPDLADNSVQAEQLWPRWPVFSPALRRTLPLLDAPERAALLADLQDGGGDLYAYGLTERATDKPAAVELSAWPLPASCRQGRAEQVFTSPLEATTRVGESAVLGTLARQQDQLEAKAGRDAVKHTGRLLTKLKGEKVRLSAMAAGKAAALALQAELYRFAPDEKQAEVCLAAWPDRPLPLNPRLTVRENMAALFHQAARGERGLAMLQERVRRLEAEQAQALARAEAAARRAGPAVATPKPVQPAAAQPEAVPPLCVTRPASPQAVPPVQAAPAVRPAPAFCPRNVQAFYSADNFLLLRGRDADGNARLLKIGAPHDLWLHVGGAAGAHVIIRRDHAGQVVPEQTLRQAGLLAMQKSERRGEAAVDVVVALVRHVHPIRGARAGAVRIDETAQSLTLRGDEAPPTPAETKERE